MSTSTDPTDKAPKPLSSQSPGGRATAYTPWYVSNWLLVLFLTLLTVSFCIIGFIPYWPTFRENVQKTLQLLNSSGIQTPAVTSPAAEAPEAGSDCVIVWVEHQADNLGNKNRARVWERIISEEVKSTGMTPREFYDQVVEHNPQLIEDDYEFKTGKTYLLPECQ